MKQGTGQQAKKKRKSVKNSRKSTAAKSTTVDVDANGEIDIEQFRGLIDLDKVVYYNISPNKNGVLYLQFYDKEKKLIEPYKVKS